LPSQLGDKGGMRTTSLASLLALALVANLSAIDRKPLAEVDIDAFTEESQAFPSTGYDHMCLFWWVPVEFWAVTLESDPSIDAATRNRMINALENFAVLGVVQGDIDDLGQFKFYDEATVKKNLQVVYADINGKKVAVTESSDIPADVNLLLTTMKPLLANAMGNMGQSLHFFVYDDVNAAGDRVVDPYQKGTLALNAKTLDNKLVASELEFPLDALFIPRKCPNGRNAHVSWVYCPWSGEKLPE